MTKRNIVHIELPAADQKKAGKFYHDLFGWQIEYDPELKYVQWDAGSGSSGGFNTIGDEFKAGEIIFYVASEDIEADLKAAAKLGGLTVQGKTEIPNIGWYGIFKDPSGNRIGLYTSRNPEFNKQLNLFR